MKNKLFGISLLTVTCMYGLLAGLVILVVMLFGGDILYAIIGSIIVLLIQFLISPWLTDLSMRWFYHCKFDEEIPDYLKTFIENECQKHNVKYPKIGIINDGAPNAFTYGRTKKSARIVLTRGLFELLDQNEVISVVGHEMGHIVHMDMMVMTFAQLVPLVLYAIFEMFTKNNDHSDSDSNKGAIIGIIAYILYIISQYIVLYLSRTREYYADAFSIEETKNPNSLASALVKVGFGLSVNHTDSKHDVNKNNALGIMSSKDSKAMAITSIKNGKFDTENIKNAMKWEMWNPWAKWFEFNSTHPLISKRLIAISKRSNEFNQTPFVTFDLKKEESYVDDFLLEILISFLPSITLLGCVFAFFAGRELFPNYYKIVLSSLIFLTTLFSFIKFTRAHKKGYTDRKVSSLLSEVKVSHITSVPCILKGTIIGRGNPGCIFNEDFVIQDDTGIMFLDYNQPITILNKIFAIFKSEKYFNKEITVKGWYRRNPVPYVEIYEYTVDGQTKKIFTYPLGIALHIVGLVLGIVVLFL